MPKLSPLLFFFIVLLTALGLVFYVHTLLLDNFGHPKYGNLIVTSYWLNGGLAALIYVVLFLFRKRLKNYIGYLFIGGSFLKFILFFILFYPAYRADGEMDRTEFAAFFVPYLTSLIIETLFTVKMLKVLDKKSP